MDSRQKLQARFSILYAIGALLLLLLLQEYVIGPMVASEKQVIDGETVAQIAAEPA